MSFFSFLAPARAKDLIEDQAQINRDYKYWRIRIFYSIYFGYAAFYLTRKSVTFALPFIEKDLGFTKAQLGFLATVLYLSYGFSKFVSSIASDQSNPRYFMALSLIATGIFNIAFSFSSSLFLFALFWLLNGIAQGGGWPPVAKQLTFWFTQKERGAWWSFATTAHNFGGGLIPLIITGIAQAYNWRTAISVTGGFSILIGLWLMNRMRDKPESLGLPAVEVYKNDLEAIAKTKQQENSENTDFKKLLFKEILVNRGVWMLALSYFFVYVLRTAFNDWGVFYLMGTRDYSPVTASLTITCFEIGGFLGVLAAGFASDYIFKGRRIPYMIYSTGLLALGLLIFLANPYQHFTLDCLLMGLLGFLIFGPQLLVGLASSEFVPKKVACTANGFAGLFAYLGAAFTGYPLGKVIDKWSWQGFFLVLSVCISLNFILLFFLNTNLFKSKEN